MRLVKPKTARALRRFIRPGGRLNWPLLSLPLGFLGFWFWVAWLLHHGEIVV